MKRNLLLYLPILLAACTGAPPAEQAKKPAKKSAEASHHLRDSAMVYTTAQNTVDRLTKTATIAFQDASQPPETQPFIFVDPSKKFQTILGIGGALTDAAAETFAKLPPDKQKELLTSYYSAKKGIGYTLARTNINSCDFSSDTYTYVQDNDSTLKTFNIDHDLKFKIPLIKRAIKASSGNLTLFASPWSPPAWMKTNNSMLHGGKLKPEFDQAWANYFVKFINAYKKKGVDVWGVTVQNEPMASQTWESCNYTAAEERDFIKNYLGPTFVKAYQKRKKIIAWDHNRDQIYQQASTILEDSAAAKYVYGIGFHWYESWTGGGQIFDNVYLVHEAFPKMKLLFTEGCNSFDKAKMNDWSLGERYGNSMIHDFNNWALGWTDWNILLDMQGGPNHVQNYCFAPVHADTKTGELHYLPAYYYIGHFSKFVRPGARRIASSSSRGQLLTTAFINKDKSIAVVVMNQSDQKMTYELMLGGKGMMIDSLPHSIQTVVIK